MKKIVVFITLILTVVCLVGCSDLPTTPENKNPYSIPNMEAFRLSSIVDISKEDRSATYKVVAPYSDTYKINCTKSSKIVIYTKDKVISEGTTEIEVKLEKGQI